MHLEVNGLLWLYAVLNTPVASDIDADVLECVIYMCPKRATLRIHTISQSHDLFRSIIVNVLSVFLESCIDQYDFLLCPSRPKSRMRFVLFETAAVSVECVLGQDYLIT